MELNPFFLASLLQCTSIDRCALLMRAKKKKFILSPGFYYFIPPASTGSFLFHSFIRASLSLSHSLSSHLWDSEAHLSQFTLSTPVQSLHSLSQLWSLRPTPPKPNITEAQLWSLNSHWSPTSPKLNSGPLDPRRQSPTSLKLNSGPSTFR